jgi:hypothetical protein
LKALKSVPLGTVTDPLSGTPVQPPLLPQSQNPWAQVTW